MNEGIEKTRPLPLLTSCLCESWLAYDQESRDSVIRKRVPASFQRSIMKLGKGARKNIGKILAIIHDLERPLKQAKTAVAWL